MSRVKSRMLLSGRPYVGSIWTGAGCSGIMELAWGQILGVGSLKSWCSKFKWHLLEAIDHWEVVNMSPFDRKFHPTAKALLEPFCSDTFHVMALKQWMNPSPARNVQDIVEGPTVQSGLYMCRSWHFTTVPVADFIGNGKLDYGNYRLYGNKKMEIHEQKQWKSWHVMNISWLFGVKITCPRFEHGCAMHRWQAIQTSSRVSNLELFARRLLQLINPPACCGINALVVLVCKTWLAFHSNSMQWRCSGYWLNGVLLLYVLWTD